MCPAAFVALVAHVRQLDAVAPPLRNIRWISCRSPCSRQLHLRRDVRKLLGKDSSGDKLLNLAISCSIFPIEDANPTWFQFLGLASAIASVGLTMGERDGRLEHTMVTFCALFAAII